MAEITQLANKARTTLSQALGALQSSPNVPDELMNIAEPIAKTMGILHKIERAGTGEVDQAEIALDNVRGALNQLQSVSGGAEEAVEAAMEAVAGSLSKLFALNKALKAIAAQPAPEPKAAPAKKARRSRRAPKPEPAQALERPPALEIQPEPPAPQPAPAPKPAPQGQFAQTQKLDSPPDAFAQPPQRAPVQQAPQARPAQAQRVPGTTDAPLPPTTATTVDVELGAHSGSNFYKGLSGNDVIDHGGIFVATYKIVPAGQPVALRIHLPGDLEFEGDAIVQWTRDTRSGESEPGYGAKFTRISAEGRQLVYRYVRNREPMFYDDM